MIQDAVIDLLDDLQARHPEVYEQLMFKLKDKMQVDYLKSDFAKLQRGGDLS